jgi:sphingosine kinase
MDIVRVETKKQIMFSFLTVGWGLIADIDIESERLRALGGQRFTLWSVHRLINLRTYRGKVSYIPALVSVDNKTLRGHHRETLTLKHSMSYNTTLNCQECRGETNCETCDTNFSDVLSLETGHGRDRLDSWFSATSRKSTYFSTADSVYESVTDRSSFSNSRLGTNNCQMYGPPSRLPALTTAIHDTNWKTIEGEFVMVHAAYQPHIGADAFLAPLSKLNDGIIWLAIIKGGISRSQLLSFLLGLSTGTHIPAQTSEYIQMIPVTAFRIEPHVGTTGVMTVDGEAIDYGEPNIQ